VTDLDYIRNIAGRDHGLAVVAVARDDGTVAASVVNAGVLAHPVDGSQVVAFVSGAASRRLERLRAGHPITVTFRAGWTWASVEGCAEIVGPDDPHPQLDGDALSELLRAIFTAAGGTHDDWAAYDKAMADERRPAVLIRPRRIYTNPSAPQVMTEL
jgi:hypothetical protein